MDLLTILATASETSRTTVRSGQIVPIDALWQQITSLGFLEALTFISFGVICIMYGWRVFKALVVIAFALIGMLAGVIIAKEISGDNHEVFGGLIGLLILGALALPLIKWAVSILGAIAGGIVTAGFWYAFNFPEKYIWAGGLIGVVAGGMIAFIALKWAVMLFSSLGGSALVVVGVLALFYLWPDTRADVQKLVFDKNWFLPVALIVPTTIGFFLQYRFLKSSSGWNIQ
ncbi:MAG: hypothetical protein WCZ89_00590 [Phycisphaerae bacterium]